MSVPTGTFTGYAAIGEREDLSDIIYDISPMDTPFISNIARETASAVLHEWQTDSLATAAVNSQVEGDDPAANTASPTTRFANPLMISWKVPRVTGTLRAVNTAGRRDELSYQISKMGKEIKRDQEVALLGTQAGTAGAAASARVLAGVACWLFNNQVQLGTGATTPTITSSFPGTAPTAGTDTAWTKTNLDTAISDCWDDGGDPTVVLLNSANKKVASAFTGIATLYRDSQGVQPATIIGAADQYVSIGTVQRATLH